jgi:hypothetical protein
VRTLHRKFRDLCSVRGGKKLGLQSTTFYEYGQTECFFQSLTCIPWPAGSATSTRHEREKRQEPRDLQSAAYYESRTNKVLLAQTCILCPAGPATSARHGREKQRGAQFVLDGRFRSQEGSKGCHHIEVAPIVPQVLQPLLDLYGKAARISSLQSTASYQSGTKEVFSPDLTCIFCPAGSATSAGLEREERQEPKLCSQRRPISQKPNKMFSPDLTCLICPAGSATSARSAREKTARTSILQSTASYQSGTNKVVS